MKKDHIRLRTSTLNMKVLLFHARTEFTEHFYLKFVCRKAVDYLASMGTGR